MKHTTPSPHSPLPLRRGITLLEVLVSMFVLLFGLMGVAAVFPVASFYVTKGEQFDVSSSVVNRSFDELRARGMLQPSAWWYGEVTAGANTVLPGRSARYFTTRPDLAFSAGVQANVFNLPTAPQTNPTGVVGPGHAFVIDPAGSNEAQGLGGGGDLFPYTFVEVDESNDALRRFQNNPWSGVGLTGSRWPVRRVTFWQESPTGAGQIAMPNAVADKIFTLRDDLAVEVPDAGDQPSTLAWQIDQNGTPANTLDDIPLQAQSNGAYSWIATVVPTGLASRDALQLSDNGYGDYLYDVSVVTFHRRVPLPSVETERLVRAELLPGGELLVYSNPMSNPGDDALIADVDEAVKDIREGNWIALTGVNPQNGQFLMRWVRVLSVAAETERQVDLLGFEGGSLTIPARRLFVTDPDWPDNLITPIGGDGVAPDLRAIMLPGAVSVVTRQVRMEAPSAWSVN